MNSEGVKKTPDRLAYASLVLDVCIATITALTELDGRCTERLLLSADYALSIVVILSVALIFVLNIMRSTETRRSR